MQYLLMCCFNEELWEKLPQSRRDEIMREYGLFVQDIRRSGHLRAGAKLGPASTATTIRNKNGKTLLTDGPFAETREQVGGYHLIECRDLGEAISIAARIPSLRAGGSVEVRPVELQEAEP